VSAITCPVCGEIAAEKADDEWQMDEEIDCPCCCATLVVQIDEFTDEVWASEKEEVTP